MAPFSPVSEQASYSARIDSLYSAENERRTGVLRRSLPSGAVPASMCPVLACSDFTSAGGWRRPAAVVPLALDVRNTLLALASQIRDEKVSHYSRTQKEGRAKRGCGEGEQADRTQAAEEVGEQEE